MSDRKRPRPVRCLMCERPVAWTRHGKCHDCRLWLQMFRYAKSDNLNKFRHPARRV